MYVRTAIETRWGNLCFHAKAISVTGSECVSVALVIQRAKRIRRITLSCPASPLQYITSHNLKNFTTSVCWGGERAGGNVTEHSVYDFLYNFV